MHRGAAPILVISAALAACATEPADDFDDGKGDVNGSAGGGLFDRPLEAFFSGQDDVVGLELTMIKKVVDARRADGSNPSCEEGANPYRIRYAVFSHGSDRIIDALLDAEKNCVDVQILIESDSMFKAWDDRMVAAGMQRVGSQTMLDDRSRITADIVGITQPPTQMFGHFHLKTRIFETPGWTRVLSGSLNPNATSFLNDENLHLIGDARLVARYQRAFEQARKTGHGPFENTWDDDAPINVLFMPEAGGVNTKLRGVTRMFQWIDQENEQILLAVFSLRNLFAPGFDKSLVDLLRAKAAAGVPVWVIVDRKQADRVDARGVSEGEDPGDEDLLRAAGVKVIEVVNNKDGALFQAMHHKVAILGRTKIRVITDTANWSAAALGSQRRLADNAESLLFIDSEALDRGRTGRRYLGEWMRVAQSYARQPEAQWDADLAASDDRFGAIQARLTTLSGWPTVPVQFQVTGPDARESDGVWVRGGAAALGQWQAPAVPLAISREAGRIRTTDGDVDVAVGACEWKFVAGPSEQDIHWEQRANRVSVIAPPRYAPELTDVPAERVPLAAAWGR
jgi:phosphatidylserine/phosphatidylglycerophosphate/cardiolipin synthase-like enzyme